MSVRIMLATQARTAAVMLSLFAGLFIAPGCGSSSEATANAGPACSTSIECPSGRDCVVGQCVQLTLPNVSIEVIPPGGTPYARTQFVDVALSNQNTFDVQLTRPIEYLVEVFDNADRPIDAAFSLSRVQSIAGRPVSVSGFVTAGSTASIQLIEGTYTARIQPNELPPLLVGEFDVRARPTPERKEFRLPDAPVRISGTVISSRSNLTRISGATVQAFGEVTGLKSTSAITDADGNFEIILPTSPDLDLNVILEATPAETPTPAWSHRQSIGASVDRTLFVPIAEVDEADDVLQNASLQVLGVDSTGEPVPLFGAAVTMTATAAGADRTQWFQLSGRTDNEGQLRIEKGDRDLAEFPIIRSRYQVEIVPSAASIYARTSTIVDYASSVAQPDRQVSLRERPLVSGTVESRQRQLPVPQAILRFYRTSLASNDQFQTSTDSEGRFSIRLDAGSYVVVVEPPSARPGEEALPVYDIPVEVGTAPTQDLNTLLIPAGVVMQGFIEGDVNDVVPNATVDIYRSVLNVGNVRIGRAVTDERGQFQVVLTQGAL